MNKSKVTVIAIGIIYGMLTLTCFLKTDEEFSFSERRKLASKPVLSIESVLNGSYMKQAEEYVTDQFPNRDLWRGFKAGFALNMMQKSDTNGIYLEDGYLCSMEYPMNQESLERAGEVFSGIYEKYLKDTETNVYFSIIPDKGYFISGGKYLSMDYEYFLKEMYAQADFAESIPIHELLQLSDYYRTDTHWKQEQITDVAEKLAEAMGTKLSGEYETRTLGTPFYGVYYGQAALPMTPDEISYCTNEVLEKCKVYDYENNREIPIYDISKASGRDPYEMFYGGNISLATIENAGADTGKELVVFGDSFARSLLPLMTEGYAKITLIDIRYLPSAYVGNYVTFSDQDVLFLYSTSVLNNSITLK